MFRYTVPVVCAVFFRVVKDGKCRIPSTVCSEERTSHTPPPASSQSVRVSCVQWRAHDSHPPPCEQSVSESQLCAVKSARVTRPPPPHPLRAVSQWESAVCMMMAEGDESLELFPSSKNMKSAIWNFFGNVDQSCSVHNDVPYRGRFSADR